MKLKLILGCLALMLFSISAQARCFECSQRTGYHCYMAQGTKGGCDTPSDAGCFTWGTCNDGGGGGGRGGCDGFYPDCDPFELMRAQPMTNELEVASVSVVSPRQPTPRAASAAPAT
jgi:hypothetical protein